tara:strand:- start:794 stop:1015 length:222 start_codon:yes stop_codon:yes gene_type:complete
MPKHSSKKSNKDIIEQAHKDGKISAKQMKNLPEGLLLGIAKKGDAKGGIKETRKKPSGKVGRPKSGSMVKVKS